MPWIICCPECGSADDIRYIDHEENILEHPDDALMKCFSCGHVGAAYSFPPRPMEIRQTDETPPDEDHPDTPIII